MATVLAAHLARIASLALLDLAAVVLGVDSRDGMTDDHRR
jgi:hypothetical protein